MTASNGVYFQIVATPPLQEVGWEVRVVAESEWAGRGTGDGGAPLAVISTFIDVAYSVEISGLGVGSVTLDLDADFWRRELTNGANAITLLDFEHLWQIWEQGTLRAEFLAQTVGPEVFLEASEIRTVTVSGPLGAAALRRGRVLTPNFPAPPPSEINEASTWEFIDVASMAAWLILLAESQGRGTAPFVHPTFTPLVDSAGQPWEDTPPVPGVQGTTTTVLSGDINFASDSATLSGAATANIAAICAATTGTHPLMTCVGHADSTNTHAYNQTLSENRAQAVKTRILTHIPGAVVTAYGRGETEPIATNATSAGRARNRRVTVTYPTGAEPEPPPTYSPPLYINLLDLLVELSGADLDKPAPIRVEWIMWPGFNLDVRREFGARREAEVVFYEGSTATMGKARDRRREEIANLIAVRDGDGTWSVAANAESIAQWGQREGALTQANAYDVNARDAIARALLARDSDERASWTVSVADAPGREAWTDYGLGDWIGMSRYTPGQPSTVDAYRVMAITKKVDQDSVVSVELTLQSTADAVARRLQKRITSIINHVDDGPRVWIQDTQPLAAKIGDLWTPATPAT